MLPLQRAAIQSVSASPKKAEKDFKQARFSAMQIKVQCNQEKLPGHEKSERVLRQAHSPQPRKNLHSTSALKPRYLTSGIII